jgi:uncharacterized protein (DUF302 family)
MKNALFALALIAATAPAAASPVSASRAGTMQTALDDLSLALIDHGYELVKVQPIDQALVKRGYPDPGVRIVFIGKASGMEQAMKTDPRILSMLPLRLTLIVTKTGVMVSSDDLDMWKEMFPDPETARLIETWQRDLTLILGDFSAQ